MTEPTPCLFCFGLGYTGQRLAQGLAGRGWHVAGTVRSPEKAARLGKAGIDAQVFEGTGDVIVPAGAHWVVSVPPGDAGCPVARTVGARAGAAASVTYLSTTGVYGDLDGGWAFEWTPVAPASQRGIRRVLAEKQWLEAAPGARLVRLPGIYGPGRSALDRVRAGKARRIIKPGQVFSRVHVDDLVSGLAACLARPDLSGVLHLCDDFPAPPQDVIEYAAACLGVPTPPAVDFEAADLSAMARSFYAECKRVSNARAKAALGWRPVYRDYCEGLRAVKAADGDEARPSLASGDP